MSHFAHKPGDTDNNLLRKILEQLNAGISIVGAGDIPEGVAVVAVANFPLLQQVYGTVNIGNLPASIAVNNFPASQATTVTNEVLVMGTVDVGNAVEISTLPLPTGAATESSLVKLTPTPEFQANLYGTINGKAARAWHVLGRRAGFNSTSVLQDVAEFLAGSDALPEPTGAESWEMVSSSVDDDFPAGTGARTVFVTYIDTNNDIATVGVDLDGTTPVSLGAIRMNFILFMEVYAGGSLGVSAGNIDLRIAGGGAVYERISAGGNRSLTCRWMVPRNHTAYIADWHSTAQGGVFTADVRLRATRTTAYQQNGTRYIFQDNCFVAGGTSVEASLPWIQYPALCKIKPSLLASATAAGNRVDVDFSILMIHD